MVIITDQQGYPISSSITFGVKGKFFKRWLPNYDAEGFSEITYLPPGKYEINFSAEGYESVVKKVTIPEEGFSKDSPYEVQMEKLDNADTN